MAVPTVWLFFPDLRALNFANDAFYRVCVHEITNKDLAEALHFDPKRILTTVFTEAKAHPAAR